MNNLQLSICNSQQRENRNPENTSVKTAVKVSVKAAVKILQLLEENPSMTLAKLAAIIQKSKRAVELASSRLVKAGKLRHVGPQKGGHWEVIK